MIQCEMDYNKASVDGKTVKLLCYSIGTFDVFSGINPTTNLAECATIKNAALPPGTYWIVPRPVGSLFNGIESAVKDWRNGTEHSDWFALYNDSTMSDHMFVNGVDRGSFRLHPLGLNGGGESWGCIIFYKIPEFVLLLRSLLDTQTQEIKPGLKAYGRIVVIGRTDYENLQNQVTVFAYSCFFCSSMQFV